MRAEPTTGFKRSLALVGLSCWLVAVAGVVTRSTIADPTPGAPESVESLSPAALGLDEIGSGELLWKSPGGLVPLPVVDIDVELTVTGPLLHGRLRQSFHNPTGETIETLYVFPLPEGSAIHRMEMIIGDRRIRSVVREKEQARASYVQAKRAGRKAALVDQRRPNLFTTAAANINPGETVSIELEYYEEVPYRDGEFQLAFPLTYTPRFASTPLARVRAELRPGLSLATVRSDSHRVTHAASSDRYLVRTADARVAADRDFLLAWRPQLAELPQTATFVEPHDGERYALAMIVPPIPGSEAGLGLPTETLFVIDVSGSMDGPSIRQARLALEAALDRLRPEDTFGLLKFNDGNALFHDELLHAEGESLAAARDWVRDLQAGGGTLVYPALMRGLQVLGRSRSARPQRLVFLTDGAVGNEDEVLRGIADHLGHARLHAVGIGAAPNRYLMRKMAWLGRGLCAFIAAGEQADNRIDAFFARLDRPVMTGLELEWDGAEAIYPSRLPDLYAGEPLVIYARLSAGAGGRLRLGGQTRAGWIESVAALESVAEGGGLATRWARAQVESLMDSLHEGADAKSVRDEVTRIGLDFGMVTAYTSLVAVEASPTALGSARAVSLPAALPTGGTDARLRSLAGIALVVVGLLLLALPALRSG